MTTLGYRKKVRKAIEDADSVWVSAVTGWEIEAKRARGLLEASEDLEAAHRDPFDRMLVAQAKLEDLYGVAVIAG